MCCGSGSRPLWDPAAIFSIIFSPQADAEGVSKRRITIADSKTIFLWEICSGLTWRPRHSNDLNWQGEVVIIITVIII